MSNEPPVDPRYAELRRQYPSGPARARPIAVGMLEYERQRAGTKCGASRISLAMQSLPGLLMPYLCATGFYAIHPPKEVFLDVFLPMLVGATAFVLFGIAVRRKLGWRGLMPGVITAVLVAPVAFFFLCAAVVVSHL